MERQIFVPFSEPLVEAHGFSFGRLVPFQLEYECLRLGADFNDHEQGSNDEIEASSADAIRD